jgi:hypothetical protein
VNSVRDRQNRLMIANEWRIWRRENSKVALWAWAFMRRYNYGRQSH